jgi:hypothetical protein
LDVQFDLYSSADFVAFGHFAFPDEPEGTFVLLDGDKLLPNLIAQLIDEIEHAFVKILVPLNEDIPVTFRACS